MPMHICTIVARNYLAPARVLARSFRDRNPDGTCWTLVIDDVEHEVDDRAEPFRVLRPEDLAIGPWDRMAAGYSVLELSTAVKPWLLRHLLHDRGAERITYLDPDIQVFDSLGEVDDLLRHHALVVNPHLTAPMPRDGRKPAETDILIAGSFNLGFAGFAGGEEVDRLLDWWAERLATDCLVAPERGYFVDQRWMDFAPGLVTSLHVLRDPGYNVAYWNLSSRDVRRAGSGYQVNGRPLRFFHFSGYDPATPHLLSKHQNRIELDAQPVLRELCDAYARGLEAEGHAEWRTKPYAWNTLPDGTPLDAAARRVYRDAVQAGALPDERIFEQAGATAFLEYLRQRSPQGGKHGVTRYLAALREERRDLRESFPDLDGADGARFVAWAQVFGTSSGAVAPAMLRANPGADNGSPLLPGVNVAGYFKGVMGVGEHARQLVAALRTQGVPIATTTLAPDAAPEDESLGEIGPELDDRRFAYFNLLCANADTVPGVASQLGAKFFGDRYTIGFWAWEVNTFPERFLGAFGHLDEVWVGSRHVRDAISPVAAVPVVAIPQPVSLPERAAEAAPPPGLPDGFRFLFAFDYLSVFERKNPIAVVHAFRRAFEPGSGAVLILKAMNPGHDPDGHARLGEAIADHPDIHMIEERLPAAQRDGLMVAADCYVSLHRAEGFGYTLAEAMWLGKPVIGTGYSGNVDFMTAENSYLVDHELVPIGPGHEPYPPEGSWAQPDVEHAAKLMRGVFEDREEAARRGERAARDIRATHSPEVAGAAMLDRLRLVLASPAWRAARRGSRGLGALYTDWVAERIQSGPVPPRRARFGAAQRAARKSLLRVVKPVTVHQRLVDAELLKAVQAVDASVQALAFSHAAALRRIEELSAELAELRDGERD
jgi:glycosyltransferase involved in cell wall biosynthesis